MTQAAKGRQTVKVHRQTQWSLPILAFLISLGGCASVKNTPAQDRVWNAYQVCRTETGSNAVVQRVDPDGRYPCPVFRRLLPVERVSELHVRKSPGAAREPMITVGLGAALEAFILEHEYCGELDAGVEEDRVWMTCTCVELPRFRRHPG